MNLLSIILQYAYDRVTNHSYEKSQHNTICCKVKMCATMHCVSFLSVAEYFFLLCEWQNFV